MNRKNLVAFYAEWYHELGINTTCITNYITENNFYDSNILKGPYHEWVPYVKNRMNDDTFSSLDWDNSLGVGMVAGYDNLFVIDIDGCINEHFLNSLLKLLKLPQDYEWVVKTGSGNGYHIILRSSYELSFYVSEEEQNKTSKNSNEIVVHTLSPNQANEQLFEKIEYLIRTHVVLPPSFHMSGGYYEFKNCRMPTKFPKKIENHMFHRFDSFIRAMFCSAGIVYGHRYYSIIEESYKRKSFADNEDLEMGQDSEILFFIYDLETDGLIKEGILPRAVQISWIVLDENGVVYDRNTELINSDFNSGSSAFKINGLDPETIKTVGKSETLLAKKVNKILKKCDVICSHNIGFDLPILKDMYKRTGVVFPNNLKTFCTMKFGMKLMQKSTGLKRQKYPTLAELYEHLFNHEINQLHNATSDVNLLSKCVKEILYRGLITP